MLSNSHKIILLYNPLLLFGEHWLCLWKGPSFSFSFDLGFPWQFLMSYWKLSQSFKHHLPDSIPVQGEAARSFSSAFYLSGFCFLVLICKSQTFPSGYQYLVGKAFTEGCVRGQRTHLAGSAEPIILMEVPSVSSGVDWCHVMSVGLLATWHQYANFTISLPPPMSLHDSTSSLQGQSSIVFSLSPAFFS